jgi:chromosome segregation ATPase
VTEQIFSQTELTLQLDKLRHQLQLAEADKQRAQTECQDLKIQCNDLAQENSMLQAMITQKQEILGAPVMVWLNSRQITEYYKGEWQERMGIQVSHEGVITGFVKEP